MANPDLFLLLKTVFSFAKFMLSEQGEFSPFGATMSPSGEITDLAVSVPDNDRPPSETLIDLMTKAFQQQAARGQIRAAAICYHVHTVPPGGAAKTAAVCCCLEHSSGESVDLLIPYTKTGDSNVQYSEIFAVRRTPIFFSIPPV